MQKFKEFWKTVVINGVEHPRYMVSNFGKVKCKCIRGGKWKFCKLCDNGRGYLTVHIERIPKLVHRLVAEAFIQNPKNKPNIDHINTVKTQNVVLLDDDGKTILYTNLRWVTQKENCNNTLSRMKNSKNNAKAMLGKLGAENPSSIQVVQLTLDKKFIKIWGSAKEVERELGINNSNIIQCCKGKRKTAGGYRWMYYDNWLKVCKSEAV